MAKVENERRRLRKSLQNFRVIEATLEDIAKRVAGIDAEIQTVRERLQLHFREEEETGLFEYLVDTMPRKTAEVKQLRREHEKLCRQLDQVSGGPGAATLSSRVRDFTEALRQHEDAENYLYQRASNLDVGVGD